MENCLETSIMNYFQKYPFTLFSKTEVMLNLLILESDIAAFEITLEKLVEQRKLRKMHCRKNPTNSNETPKMHYKLNFQLT